MTINDLEDLPLFNYTTAPHNQTQTSTEAATSIEGHVNRLCKLVLAEIKASKNGLTCQEIEDSLGMSSATATPRINELANCYPPCIEKQKDDNGFFIKRANRSGRKAFVWFFVKS